MSDTALVNLGRISGLYGVKGWIRVFSLTDPREKILEYSPWIIAVEDGHRTIELEDGRRQGKGVIAALSGVDDRDAARALMGAEIYVERSTLPAPEKGTWYWVDLEGLAVVNTEGVNLGHITGFMETGAHDVMVVETANQRRLVPFVQDIIVQSVDIDGAVVTVDWHAED